MLVRNPVALEPSLDGRVISMAQLASHRADAAPFADEINVGNHSACVRTLRTFVNVESVRANRDSARMGTRPTIGSQLRALIDLAGLSYDAVAKRAGYNGRSSVQRYFTADYDPPYLPLKVAERIASAFEGTKVSPSDVLALAGMPERNARVVKFEGASLAVLPRDVPIYGTSLGAPVDFDGKGVEQTMLNTGETIGYLPRPAALNGVRNAYGLYVQGSSMSPRYDDGEVVFVTDSTKGRPPRIGDDVVVYLRDMERDDGQSASAVLVKRLVRRSAAYTELEQFNPPLVFRIEAERILRIDRVVPWAELLA